MIKMIIQMNEGKITSIKKYSTEQIYTALDKVFSQMGYSCKEVDGKLEYCGNEDPRDFGRFGRIYNTLKRQPWFLENASVWTLCNSDDADDKNDFSEEDLLGFYKRKVGIEV